jgi:hypothetical protein
MTSEEWAALRKQVDKSFWVMRMIGGVIFQFKAIHILIVRREGYPPLPSEHDGFSCGAHK